MNPAIPTLTVPIPVVLPDAKRIEELILQAAREVARERLMWLSPAEAAEYIGICKRTLERKKGKLGLPVAELDGVHRICREDLDALLRAHMANDGAVQLIAWPSNQPIPEGALSVIEWPSLVKRAKEQLAA